MAFQRHEVPNFTKDQVEGHLRDAIHIANTVRLTEEERHILLPAIFDKLSSKQVVVEQLPDIPMLDNLRPQG